MGVHGAPAGQARDTLTKFSAGAELAVGRVLNQLRPIAKLRLMFASPS
jgi:hypothetical protein